MLYLALLTYKINLVGCTQLGESIVDRRTAPSVHQRTRHWTVATSHSSVYRTVMDRIAPRISFGMALQIFGTALPRDKEISGFI